MTSHGIVDDAAACRHLRGVLLDFDGVIADTANDTLRAWRHAFKELGIQISDEDYLTLEGLPTIGIAETIGRKYGVPSEHYQALVRAKESYYRLHGRFSLYEGVTDILSWLRECHMRTAVVSGGSRSRIVASAGESFLKAFDAVVCGDDYATWKPDPGPYLAALDRIELAPHECVAVENAPLGIKSARQAGLFCIAVCTTLNRSLLDEADVIIENIRELRTIAPFVGLRR